MTKEKECYDVQRREFYELSSVDCKLRKILFWSCGRNGVRQSFSNECRTDICRTTGYPLFGIHKKVSRQTAQKSYWRRSPPRGSYVVVFVPHSTYQRSPGFDRYPLIFGSSPSHSYFPSSFDPNKHLATVSNNHNKQVLSIMVSVFLLN